MVRLAWLLLWMWLALAASADRDCAVGCSCTYVSNRYSAKCTSAGLTEVPTIGGSIMSLTLDENDFGSHIQADNYFYARQLDSLRSLSIRKSHVRSLGANAFRNMELLESLDLADNELTQLPLGLFTELTHLKHLNLAGNQLTSITAPLFDGATGLQSVGLAANTVHIDLSHNHIAHLGIRSWRNLPRLSNINLAFNRLNRLESNKFDAVKHTLQILTLEGNPWTCDCALSEFVRWQRARGFEPSTCVAPPRLSGKQWHSLQLHEFACPPSIDTHKVQLLLQPSPGESVLLYCKVAGQPAPEVVFEHSRPDVQQRVTIDAADSDGKYEIVESPQAGNLFHWSLKIHSVTPTDSGQYFCTASNPAATVFEAFTVDVQNPHAAVVNRQQTTHTTMNIDADTVLMLVVLAAALLIVCVVLGAVCCYRRTTGVNDGYPGKPPYHTNANYHYTAIEAANGKPYASNEPTRNHCSLPHHHHHHHYLPSTPGADGGPVNCLPPPPPPPSGSMFDNIKHQNNGYCAAEESVPSSVQQDDSGYLEPHDSPRLCSLHSHHTAAPAPLASVETDTKIPLKETSL